MNPVVEEMQDILMHYGVPRRSGRYPWGSGDSPYQRGRDFLGRVEQLKKSGWKETPENIMDEFGLTTTEYRIEKRVSKNERRMLDVARAKSLKEDGLGATEIGKKMGLPESTVRSLLDPKSESNMSQGRKTADFIKGQIEKKGMIEVGVGVERDINISRNTMDEALYLLKREGYPVYQGRVEQATNKGKWTTVTAVCPKGTEYKDFYAFTKGEATINSLNDYISRDGGNTFTSFVYPKSMDSKRMMIRYKEDGGIDKDGIVELRRGVEDLSLGNDHYSQVRILVDGKKYIKGMAVYSDDMPDGVDVVFNTNKTKDVPMDKVLKDIKSDPDNPFGSLIKPGGQSTYIDKNGKEQLSLINKRAGEGDWDEWKDNLPSQFLSKQPMKLIEKQLGLSKADKMAEFDEINSLTNPTVKKHMLGKFADECDSAAVHLKAAALPGQKYHVIVPINTLKDNEVYAPNYEDGTKLALIRYPHGGTFEIPILTVNNKHAAAKKIIGDTSIDAVGINKNNADRLSGADFDGDTVMCIPTHNKKVKIVSTPSLPGLEGFDPKEAYPETPGMRYMTKRQTQIEMGIASNLITDMSLRGATTDELARAVRHSMVVIDAEKHKLNYKQSELDNNIAALKKDYQDGGGASTLISKSKGEYRVDKRQGSPTVNMKGRADYDPSKPEGALLWKTADDVEYSVAKVNNRSKEPANGTIRVSKQGKRYVQFDGSDEWVSIEGKSDLAEGTRINAGTKTKRRQQSSTNMMETDDARTLISDADTPKERAYADYANYMKSLANQARKEMMSTGKIVYDKNAKLTYQKEVDSLESKLNEALKNAPRERMAQIRASAEINAKRLANPNMSKEDIKKTSQQALSRYRTDVGSIRRRDRSIKITDREWEAIQAGAISENKLKQILNNTDVDSLRERATPRTRTQLSEAKVNQIKAMSSSYTLAQIANRLGVSTSTVSKYLKGAN